MAGTFVDRVAEIITRYSMAAAGSRIGVAVSGGADSVALLHVLFRVTARSEVALSVLHLNHQLRGEESEADEEFVRSLAESLFLPFFTERTHLSGGNLEEAARDARRDFFLRIRDREALTAVALGHTRSDQAETVLFRFLRGSGTAGLAGMRFRTPEGFIRPFLEVTRGEVRDWAAAEGIAWREDSSNAEARFARNRLRNETMPALAGQFNSNLESVLANTAKVAQAEEDYWESAISTLYGQITKRTGLGLFLQMPELRDFPLAVQRRLVRRAVLELRDSLRSIDFGHIEAILELGRTMNGHDRVLVPGVDAIRSFETLLLTQPGKLANQKRQYRINLVPGQEYELPYGAGTMLVQATNSDRKYCANLADRPQSIIEIAEESDVNPGLLAVRNWEPGDEIQLPGHRNPKKIKTLFQEHKVLLWERRHWPVVVCGDEIVWVREFGCSARYGNPGPGRQRWWLSYRAGLS